VPDFHLSRSHGAAKVRINIGVWNLHLSIKSTLKIPNLVLNKQVGPKPAISGGFFSTFRQRIEKDVTKASFVTSELDQQTRC
jgi:hypothetical protein